MQNLSWSAERMKKSAVKMAEIEGGNLITYSE